MAIDYARLLGQHIRRLREEAGLAQDVFAAQVGCSPSAVCQWEHGVNVPRLATLIKMAQVLSTTVGHLVHPIDVRLAASAAPRSDAALMGVEQGIMACLAHQQCVLADVALEQGVLTPQALSLSSHACGEVYGERA